MKKLVLLLVMAAMSMSFAVAEDVNSGVDLSINGITPGFNVSMDYVGKYIWRGQNLQDDGGFQATIEMTLDKLTLGMWANMDLSDFNGNNDEFTEFDYYVDYSDAITETVGYSVGIVNYYLPSNDDATEIYAGINLDSFMSPSVTLYNTADAAGTYVQFAVGHSEENIGGSDFGMEFGASLGYASNSYNKEYWTSEGADYNDLAVSLAFPLPVGEWTLTPNVNYVTLVSSDTQNSDNFDTASDYLYFGLGLSTSF